MYPQQFPEAPEAPQQERGGLQVAKVWQAGPEETPAVAGRPTLPRGVYWSDQTPPDNREELFRVNGRIYTVPKKVDAKVIFRQMRRIHEGHSEMQAAAEAMYDVLGEGVVDFLADEDLSEPEMDAVMAAITKYMTAAVQVGLGKSQNGSRR